MLQTLNIVLTTKSQDTFFEIMFRVFMQPTAVSAANTLFQKLKKVKIYNKLV